MRDFELHSPNCIEMDILEAMHEQCDVLNPAHIHMQCSLMFRIKEI